MILTNHLENKKKELDAHALTILGQASNLSGTLTPKKGCRLIDHTLSFDKMVSKNNQAGIDGSSLIHES